ncbi:MAG: hypothetical protein LBH98_05620 [Chitinispirillales bacterium]|jgi:hypothetical protein|nr:hypothetical protein [Chitinispirillales bacterium]
MNLILAILTALLFVSCCCDEKKNDEPQDINAKKLIGTWRDSTVVDLDSIVEMESVNPPIPLLGKAIFYIEWTFNEDRKTGLVNAYLDLYKRLFT